MGSRFTPLTEMDTVEDVPTTHANDAIQATPVADGPPESGHRDSSKLGRAIRTWQTWNTPFWERWQVVSKRFLASAVTRVAFSTLDGVDLVDAFAKRARVFKSPPAFLKGAFRSCLRLALEEVECGRSEFIDVRSVRGWKLFLLVPRLLLYRGARGGKIPKKQLQERFTLFAQGHWLHLLRLSAEAVDASAKREQIRSSSGQSVPRCLPSWVNCLLPGRRWRDLA